MKRFWISWYSPIEPEEQIPYPCWITGERSFRDEDNFAYTYVADVQAEDEDAAYAIIEELFPNLERRFCSKVSPDWKPSDRFQ